MLKKTMLRALSPGQWARVRVPDRDCWHKCYRCSPGDEVDICLVPSYEPQYDYPRHFRWVYRVHWRRAGSDYVHKESHDGWLCGY